jgi:hypothetical protein
VGGTVQSREAKALEKEKRLFGLEVGVGGFRFALLALDAKQEGPSLADGILEQHLVNTFGPSAISSTPGRRCSTTRRNGVQKDRARPVAGCRHPWNALAVTMRADSTTQPAAPDITMHLHDRTETR